MAQFPKWCKTQLFLRRKCRLVNHKTICRKGRWKSVRYYHSPKWYFHWIKLIFGIFRVAFVWTRGVFCKVVPFGLQYPIIRELNSYRNRSNIQLSGNPIKWALSVVSFSVIFSTQILGICPHFLDLCFIIFWKRCVFTEKWVNISSARWFS